MPRGVKIGLIVMAVLVVVGGGTCGAFVAWVKSNEATWQSAGKEAAQAGQRFGAAHLKVECVDEAVERSAACEKKNAVSEAQCFAFEGIFLDQCLAAARTEEGHADVCEGTPKGLVAAMGYAKEKCEVHSGRKGCLKTYQQLAQICSR